MSFLPFGTFLSPPLCNSYEMLIFPPKPHMLCPFTVVHTNYVAPSWLSTQCKCKYIISQCEAKIHFRTLKISFLTRSPDGSQAMIFIIALLHCSDYNFAIGQAAGDSHKQKMCSYSVIPQNAGKCQ